MAALVVAFGCAVAGSAPEAQRPGDWIDVHVHRFADQGARADFHEAARQALRIMDAERIRTMIVMSPPRAREGSGIITSKGGRSHRVDEMSTGTPSSAGPTCSCAR